MLERINRLGGGIPVPPGSFVSRIGRFVGRGVVSSRWLLNVVCICIDRGIEALEMFRASQPFGSCWVFARVQGSRRWSASTVGVECLRASWGLRRSAGWWVAASLAIAVAGSLLWMDGY